MEDTRNRTRGVLAEMSAKLSDQGAPDWILEERVRSNFGRLARHTGAVQVRADGGRIHLSGPVLRQDVDDIVRAAARTRGVHEVENELQAVDTPEDIPALQGALSSRRMALPEWQQRNWSPAMRLLSGVGGSLLTLYGLRRRGVTKPILSTVGLVLTARGVTNMYPRSMLGLGLGENAIRVQKAINMADRARLTGPPCRFRALRREPGWQHPRDGADELRAAGGHAGSRGRPALWRRSPPGHA